MYRIISKEPLILFDVGGVLVRDYDVKKDVRTATGATTDETFTDRWTKSVALYGSGKISRETFWQQLTLRADTPNDVMDSIVSGFEMNYRPYHRVLEFAGELRTPREIGGFGLKTAILSDSIPEHSNFLRNNGVYDGFSPCLLSYEIGMRKPSVSTFNYVVERVHQPADAIIFIDNRETNLEGARKIGMKTVLASGSEDEIIKTLLSEIQRF